jgi:hypothetical protein
VAAFLAPILPIYAECGLLDGPLPDEAGVLAACRAIEWPEATAEPASIQDWRLLQAVLARCGMRDGGGCGLWAR